MTRVRFHGRFSYPPRRWRDKGWRGIHNGATCWAVLTNDDGTCYNVWRVRKLRETNWPDENLDEENPLFVCVDESGAEYAIDASRIFKRKREARIEAVNLELFRNQWAARTKQERLNNMGKQWPHEQVSEVGALLPEALLTVKIIDGEEGESRNGNYQILFNTRVVEPRNHKNAPYKVQFTIGNQSDPDADEPETWTSSFAASRYKSFLKAADVPETGDIEEEIEAATGTTLLIDNGHSADGKYNDPRAFYRLGERESDSPEPRRAAKPSKAPVKPMKSSKPGKAPVETEPEDGDEWEDD